MSELWRVELSHTIRVNLGNGKRERIAAVYVMVQPCRVNPYTTAGRLAEAAAQCHFLRPNRRLAKNAAYTKGARQVQEIDRTERHVKVLTDTDVVRYLFGHYLDCFGNTPQDRQDAWKSALKDQRTI